MCTGKKTQHYKMLAAFNHNLREASRHSGAKDEKVANIFILTQR